MHPGCPPCSTALTVAPHPQPDTCSCSWGFCVAPENRSSELFQNCLSLSHLHLCLFLRWPGSERRATHDEPKQAAQQNYTGFQPPPPWVEVPFQTDGTLLWMFKWPLPGLRQLIKKNTMMLKFAVNVSRIIRYSSREIPRSLYIVDARSKCSLRLSKNKNQR